jgi:phosphoglycolate phosphatase-like HAD superfamily hydrolase
MPLESGNASPIEIVRPFEPRPDISHVIFDFDGTISWLRHGWPELMSGIFTRYIQISNLQQTWAPATIALQDHLLSEILSQNGKPTIFQMRSFAETMMRLGGKSPSPEDLLEEYQSTLDRKIIERMGRVRNGDRLVEDYLIFGARKLVEALAKRGLKLIILSGTIEHRVKEEADFLQVSHYFKHHIYGGHADPGQFSKKAVIERLLREEKIEGRHLLSFGDGPVELQNTDEIGGLAVGVASDEMENGSGKADTHKREQLILAGAHMIIADYRQPEQLLKKILGT